MHEPFVYENQGKYRMTLTIPVDDVLVDQLRKKAAVPRLSVEQFVADLLHEAVGQLEVAEYWESQNQRRLALIRKSATTTLPAEEITELEGLQAALDRQLEPMDDQLLAGLHRMSQAVNALPDDAAQ